MCRYMGQYLCMYTRFVCDTFDLPFSPNTADSAERGTPRITLRGSKMQLANLHMTF